MTELKNRRKFFAIIGKGILGVSLFSSIPFSIFSKNIKEKKLKTVKIHPSAVKRNK